MKKPVKTMRVASSWKSEGPGTNLEALALVF
jgi:hypothetical protein